MKSTVKPNILWDDVIEHFGMIAEQVFDDPDMIVHEVAHLLDCVGPKVAFSKIGPSKNVNKIIVEHCKSQAEQDLNEIAASAISYLVCQWLGECNLKEVLSSMCGNLSEEWYNPNKDLKLLKENVSPMMEAGRNKANLKFIGYLKDEKINQHANEIIRFLKKYQTNATNQM